MRTNPLTATWIVLLASSFGCAEQRGDAKRVDEEIPDVHPPSFVAAPEVVNVSANHAEILFAFNESSNGSLVVRTETELSLTHADIENASDRYAVDAKAFETIRVLIGELTPNQDYITYLTARDQAGNMLGEPVAVPFQTPSQVSELALGGDVPAAKQGVPWSFQPSGMPSHCTLALDSGPEWLAIDSSGKFVHGIPSWSPGQETAVINLRLTGENCQGKGTFETKISGDPLYDYAWHINPGAGAVSWFSSPPVIDSNVPSLWGHGFTGAGVHVTVVDSGMQIDHPDLVNNIDLERNINLDPLASTGCQVCDPQDTSPPRAPGEPGDQGTAVAGIIAAEGWNGLGARGVAPGAKISAYNVAAQRFRASDNDYLRIFSIAADVICHSAAPGPEILTELPAFDYDAYDSAQKSRVHLGRDGKGTVYIKAAGDLGAVKGNAAFDQRTTTSWGVVVGSHNTLGQKSHASSPGANLWLSAAGGEAGYQGDYRAFVTPMPALHFYPSIIAPDIFNDEFPCSVGFAKKAKYFDLEIETDPNLHGLGHSSGFNLGWHEQNEHCRYTASLNASPAATAVVSGVVALLLEANPELTWRDVKYILAKSAQPIDENRAAEITSVAGSLYEKTLPWITNAAGFRFHNWYGFGALDAASALNMAKASNFETLPPLFDTNWILADSSMLRIPPASISGVFSDFFSVHDVLIESIQIRVNITHENASHLGLEVVSPNGTRSVLKPIQDGARFANMNDMVFLSNAFYGERSRGTWQLRVVDGKQGARPGDLTSWYIRITGHKTGTN